METNRSSNKVLDFINRETEQFRARLTKLASDVESAFEDGLIERLRSARSGTSTAPVKSQVSVSKPKKPGKSKLPKGFPVPKDRSAMTTAEAEAIVAFQRSPGRPAREEMELRDLAADLLKLPKSGASKPKKRKMKAKAAGPAKRRGRPPGSKNKPKEGGEEPKRRGKPAVVRAAKPTPAPKAEAKKVKKAKKAAAPATQATEQKPEAAQPEAAAA